VTATLAGQIVMEGFLHLRMPPWLRRLIRALAIIPVVVVILLFGDQGAVKLLVLSQVVLSMVAVRDHPAGADRDRQGDDGRAGRTALAGRDRLGDRAGDRVNVKLLVDTFAGA
jgi:manganese transport protein